MHRIDRTTYLFLAIGFVVLGPWWPAHADQKSSALDIFDAALAKFEADRVALHKWQYHQTLTTQQFDKTGKVTARGTWHSIVRPGDPGPLEYTGKKVDGKITFFDSSPDSSPTGQGKPVAAKPKPATAKTKLNEAESAVAAVRKYNLRNRYQWKRLPDGIADGEEAYVLTFSPKPHQNTRTREERFFGLLAGRMWVSKRDYTVLRAEGTLQAPCSLFWVIARVTVFRFNYDAGAIQGDNRLLRLSKATAQTEVTFPFVKVRQKHWQTVDSYEARTARGAGASAARVHRSEDGGQ